MVFDKNYTKNFVKMINLLYIDLFCGAGGTSTGVEKATFYGDKCAKVIACVNHDANAIASHAANHPDALHFTEDIRTLELSPLVAHTERLRLLHPDAYLVLWASLECTNFSKAKGGMPRDADSRTLAEHLFRYIEALRPDYIQIENVEEFMSWGDMDENGHPISKDKGKSYVRWVNNVCKYGYYFDWRILNAADFGAYTTRKRYFGQFARKGLPIAFPTQTHAKSLLCRDGVAASHAPSIFPDNMKPWKPVREVLDLNDEGESIFGRKKPLVEKTLERIYAGLIKFVAGGKEAFLVKWNSMKDGRYNTLAYAKVQFLSKQFGGDPAGKNISVEEPAGTITCRDHHAFVSAHYGNGYNTSVDAPAPTLTCKDRLGLVTSKFIVNYRFNNNGSSIEEPAPTICTVGQLSVADCKFLANEYSGGGQLSSIEQPNPAVMTTPKQKLVSVKPCSVCGDGIATKYLMNPQFASKGGSIDKPCFTLIARMDKMPPYLVQATVPDGSPSGKPALAIAVYESDSEMTKRIKEFMALYGIIDIKMRMLKIPELKKIMGFPEDYVLVGTQAEQKKFIGNAVEVNMSRVLCEALCQKLSKQNLIAS